MDYEEWFNEGQIIFENTIILSMEKYSIFVNKVVESVGLDHTAQNMQSDLYQSQVTKAISFYIQQEKSLPRTTD